MSDWKIEQASEALQKALNRLHLPFDKEQFRWEGLMVREYKEHPGTERGMGWRGIVRYDLGRPPVIPAQFALRYFEIEPGGYSSLEKHQHVHLVITVRGNGKALVGERLITMRPYDIVYVPPDVPHRWMNPFSEPFGFLCVVDAERDRPRPISETEWERLRANPETAEWVF